MERQKERLANIMAFGEDIDPHKKKKAVPQREPTEMEDVDRFDECKLAHLPTFECSMRVMAPSHGWCK